MSLISTYQGRKSLFAEKLEDKGVEASSSDGLTTLINKIDDIEEGFTEGLLLYAENNIVQKEDTVDLYALLLEDGKPVPNKTVEFMGLWSIVAGRISHVPPHYKITNIYDSSGIAYLDDDHHFKIENSYFYKDDVQQSDKGIYTIELNQNNLTVVYIGGTSSTFDVSNYDMSVIETNKNMLEIIFYASGTTGSDGVASYTYTGVGEGLKEVYAKYGTLVSEPYEVLDALFYDSGVSGTLNTDWVVESGLTATPSSTGILLENSTSGGKYLGANLHDTTTGELKDYNTPIVVEFTAISGTGVRMFIQTSSGGTALDKNFTSSITGNNKVKFIIRNNNYDLIIDDGTPTTTSCNLVNPVGVRFVVNASCNFKFKDFKIYPI